MKPILLFALALFAAALGATAQTPTFEVASIKPNASLSGGSSIRGATGRITMENVSLRKVTLWAYGIPDDREYALIGPDWLGNQRFDIQATFPAGATPEQVRQMTQRLLADRFNQSAHRETRQGSIYALVIAKNGPRIHAVDNGQSRTSGGPGRLEAQKIPMAKLADLLARLVGHPVVDETALPGVFDFTLQWSPDETQKLGPADESAAATSSSGPSLFAALQEQLGIRLEGRKGPIDVLVVDHMEKTPTGN